MSATTLPVLHAGDGLSAFLEQVWRYPVLEPEEEYMLAKRLREHGDTEAAHTLITSHLRLVVKIAFKYRNYGLPLPDMISEGTIGLMCAVKNFEPERGFRLATYAMWWIRAKIQEFILNSWSLVRAGSLNARRRLFWSLRRIREKLGFNDVQDLTDEQADEIGRALNVSVDKIHDINRWLLIRDTSLNQPASIEGSAEKIDLLPDDSPNQEEVFAETEEREYIQMLVRQALTTLDDRERRIIEKRFLLDEPMTLEEIGAEFGVSRERIRQLELRAVNKLRTALGERGRRLLGTA